MLMRLKNCEKIHTSLLKLIKYPNNDTGEKFILNISFLMFLQEKSLIQKAYLGLERLVSILRILKFSFAAL